MVTCKGCKWLTEDGPFIICEHPDNYAVFRKRPYDGSDIIMRQKRFLELNADLNCHRYEEPEKKLPIIDRWVQYWRK